MKFCLRLALLFVALCLPVSGKDAWTRVESTHFLLVGNADEAKIKLAAAKLEHFRRVLQQIFPQTNLDSATPTTVIVFRDDAAFKSFKPINDNGATRDNVRGYFQPGLDKNYIALSAEGDDARVFGTIFHEYTHFAVNNRFGRARIPAWFNEGLACYYQTLRFENEKRAIIGEAPVSHVQFLQREEPISLETFFNVDYVALRNQGAHGNSQFYSQAWLLMHYLQQNGRREQLNQFINLLLADKPPRAAFQIAFQIDYAALESELKKYLAQRSFQIVAIDLKEKLNFDASMRSTALPEAEALAFTGDLLLHANRLTEAAALLGESLSLDQNSTLAHAAIGMTLVRQNDFANARRHLEKAVRLDSRNYLTNFLYAYALSREDLDANGYARFYLPEKAAQMQTALGKAIELNPNFAESYRLLAFINVANNYNLNEAVELLDKALSLAPGNQQYQLELAQIYLRQEKLNEAREIAKRVFDSAENVQVRGNAQVLLANIARYEAELKRSKEIAENPELAKPTTIPDLPEAELINQARNEALRRLRTGEKRIVGYLTAIDCGKQNTVLSLKSDNQEFRFTIANLQKLFLVSFTTEAYGKQFGCDTENAEHFVVATFRPNADRDSNINGEIVALEFMPKEFKLLP